MKNLTKLLGIIAVGAVIIFHMAGCVAEEDPVPPAPEVGVYLGLISFAGNAEDLNDNGLVYLDSTGKNTLIDRLYSGYNKSSQPGTALFYGVHKALANLSSNAGGSSLPRDIYSVNILTFTDGLDNGSFGASNTAPIEGKNGVKNIDYAAYISQQLGSGGRTIKGKSINAYSVGVQGDDVTDVAGFRESLNNIASQEGNARILTDFGALQGIFSEIANELDVVHSSTDFSMTTTQNNPGTIVRMTFDVSGTSPAEAENSTKYLQGTLNYANSTWTLTDIQYSPGIASTSAVNGATITGRTSGSEVIFLFSTLTGCNPSTDPVKQWTKASSESPAWQINSEYSAGGATTTTVDKRTALIYLVLDASTSLSNDQVGQIRTAVDDFINTLYSRSSGDELNTPSSAPTAPTGVSAAPQSSSAIRVSWNPVSSATSYEVYTSSSSSGTYTRAGSPTANSFISSSWNSDTTVYFKVRAVNRAGTSGFSSVVSATTLSGSSGGMPWDGYTVTPLSSSTSWRSYSLSASNPERWFEVTTTSANYLKTIIAARDSEYSSSYTGDVVFEVYGGITGTYQLELDVGQGNHTTAGANYIDFTSPGTLYIKARAFNNSSSNYGTFAIYFNTNAR